MALPAGRNLLLAAALAAGLTLPLVTHVAPQGEWVGSVGEISALPHPDPAPPAWDPALAHRFPGCSGRQTQQVGDLVVHTTDGTVRRWDFGRAWRRNHNATRADDVWVVGWCR